MKLFNLILKHVPHTLAGIAVIITSVFLGSCEKPTITSEDFEASNLRVVNGLPGPTGVQFHLDEFDLTLGGTIDFNEISPKYYVVESGSRTASFYSTDMGDSFASMDIQLEPNKEYTLYLAGSVGAPKFWLTEDDLIPAPADKAKLRLANLASTGGNIDVTIQLDGSASEVSVFSNVAPESVSEYKLATVPATIGNTVSQPHTIRIYQAGISNLLASMPGVDLRGTSIHTIILTGVNGGTPALSLNVDMEWLDW